MKKHHDTRARPCHAGGKRNDPCPGANRYSEIEALKLQNTIPSDEASTQIYHIVIPELTLATEDENGWGKIPHFSLGMTIRRGICHLERQ